MTARAAAVCNVIRVLLILEVILFLVPAVLHAGVRIPLGFADLDEPVIVPATIVEGLIGLGFAVATYGVFTRAARAWPRAVAAHVFALVGTLIGIGATFSGEGERTELNTAIHIIMLVVVLAGLALLLTAAGQAALGRPGSEDPTRGDARRRGRRPVDER